MRLAERRAEENLVFVPLLRRKRSYSAGNTWRHRLKRNQISSHPGLRELRAPVCAPNPTPASEQRPSLALEPERAGPRSPEVALGRRGPTSGGDRNRLGVPGLSPPTHAFPNLLGPSGSPPAPVKVFPRPQAPLGLEVGEEGGSLPCLLVSAGGRALSLRVQVPRALLSRLDAHARPQPAVLGSRGDGRPLTRGAQAARRGLDHWAAEGAARRAGPARPGPLICLYYP